MPPTTPATTDATAPPTNPGSPDDAVRVLMGGNARFVDARSRGTTAAGAAALAAQGAAPGGLAPVGTVERQAPFAVVFACSDARVPAEIVFDTGPNRLFVVRVAGNVPGDECVGSIEYAVRTFKQSVRVTAVVGHTGCGAVTAAVTSYLNPKGYGDVAFSRALRAIVNHLLVAVRSAALSLEQVYGAGVALDPGYRAALVELTVHLNAGFTAYMLQKEMVDDPPVVFGVYDLATSRVGFPDPAGHFEAALRPAPKHPDELVSLGRMVAAADVVRARLTAAPAGGPVVG